MAIMLGCLAGHQLPSGTGNRPGPERFRELYANPESLAADADAIVWGQLGTVQPGPRTMAARPSPAPSR